MQQDIALRNTVFTDEISKEVYEQTYRFGKENINLTHYRVARDLASVEKDPKEWTEKFLDILENFSFVPGGRITSNAGTALKGTTYINCFVSGFCGEDQDSMEGILNVLARQAMILKSEGGYGFCANVMRPRGAYIGGIGNESPGAVRMLDMWDTQSAVITAGSEKKKKDNNKGKIKIRKGAQMVTMSCWHPDIVEFITAKQTPGRLTKFNMSVLITNEFMDAVEAHGPWILEFPDYEYSEEVKGLYKKTWDGNLKKWKEQGLPVKIYQEYTDANELWDIIMKSTYNRNEPGVLFVDIMNKLNNLYYAEYVDATNPCLVADTLVYVADGRGHVTIGELAKEGKDVPVFCLDDNGKVAIRVMRNPRLTGSKQKIYKVTLDDGNSFRVTGNHKFRLKDGQYVETKDLKNGDSLHMITKFEANIKEIFPNANSNSSDYYWINSGGVTNKSEHRLIAAFANNDTPIPSGYVVHHGDFNSKNNDPDNLFIMSKEEHDRLHGDYMKGDNNPMRRAKHEWSDEKWQTYKANMSEAVSGENNGRYMGVTNEELKEHALILTERLNRRFSNKDWMDYASENKIPAQFSKWRNDHLGGVLGLAKWAALKLGFDKVDADPRSVRMYEVLTSEGYNCVFEDNTLFVLKNCEICGTELKVRAEYRERSICSSDECRSKKASLSNRRRTPEQLEEYQSKSRVYFNNYKAEAREKQLKVYSDLKFRFGREVMREEWEKECKTLAIPFRLGKSSPFRAFRELKSAAEMYNHKVVSVEIDGIEDVYNGTVDEYHNFFVGGFEGITESGKRKWLYFNNLQCGEQILPVGGTCLLGSLNLTQFLNFEKGDWDYEKLGYLIPIIVRFMDNVNDITYVPLEEQRQNLRDKRRIGLGVMGYGSALTMLKLRYGSEKALKLTEELMDFIMNTAYQASSDIAAEKGSFPLYDEEKYLSGQFVKNLSPATIEKIKKQGLRNSHLLSIQPTGNSSVFANNVSGGLEPIFMTEYIRTMIMGYTPEGLVLPTNIDWAGRKYDISYERIWNWITEGDETLLRTVFEGDTYKIDRNRGLLRECRVMDYAVRFLEEKGEWDPSAEWVATTTELTIDEHVSTMSVFSRYIDSAMSKTVNLPNDYPYEDFKRLYTEVYKTGTIKGCTTYRAGTMATVLASVNESKEEQSRIIKNNAPKRPAELPCNIHHVTAMGDEWIVLVGMMDKDPYEVFAFKKSDLKLSDRFKEGMLVKITRGKYKLVTSGITIDDLKEHFDTDEHEALTRMISTSLRHGADIEFVVDQLQKSEGTIVSFAKAIARTLKKYLKSEVKEEDCPECGEPNGLIRKEGCISCKCGKFSKCG